MTRFQPWLNTCSLSLSLAFLICKMGIIVLLYRVIKADVICQWQRAQK